MVLTAGTQLGPYRVLSVLGTGGVGEVYRARDTRLGRDVAVKVLGEPLLSSAKGLARFEREAKLASTVNHPHICALYDVGREGDTDYLVMELVEGETLARRVSRGALPSRTVAAFGAQIAEALAHAHRAGIVHLDLKPGNIMLTKSGAKLTDFGLARALASAAGPGQDELEEGASDGAPWREEPITMHGVVAGTVPYMAPEQIEGREADARADVWALGCLLYEMATGRRAFQAPSTAGVVAAILHDSPRPMTELASAAPPALERLVNQCLAKDPEERWQSAHDLGRELRWIAEDVSRGGAVRFMPFSRSPLRALAWSIAAVAIIAPYLTLWANRKPEWPSVFTPLTWKPMTIFTAGFAPDGKTALFTAGIDGERRRIFIRRPESLEHQPLGPPGTQLLSISSSGELAVLIGIDHLRVVVEGTLARLPLAGGTPREIVEHVRAADWSPDGAQLAIIRATAGKDLLEYPIGNVLWESPGWVSRLRVSPRGDRIAFFDHPVRGDNRGSVKVVDLHGVGRSLTGECFSLEGLAWSRDGREILFSASDGRSPSRIYAVTANGRHRIALDVPGGQTIHDVSREGRWVTSRDERRSSMMVRRAGWSEERDLSWLSESGAASLSRDGSRLAFTEYGTVAGRHYAAWLRGTDGSPPIRLGEGTAWGISPDGAWVLAGVPSTPPMLVAYPTGPGQVRRLVQGSMASFARAWWHSCGDTVIFVGSEPGKSARFYVQSVAGELPSPVTPEGTSRGTPALDSPHVLASPPGERYSVYALGGGKSSAVLGVSPSDRILWWHAGRRTALVTRAGEVPARIEQVDLATGRRARVLEIESPDRTGLTGYSFIWVSEDCRSYSYTAERMLSTLFLAESRE